jgi:hypothetical protein
MTLASPYPRLFGEVGDMSLISLITICVDRGTYVVPITYTDRSFSVVKLQSYAKTLSTTK